MDREIRHDVPAPHLGAEAIVSLTELCFGEQDPLKLTCETAFIFGSHSASDQAAYERLFCQLYNVVGVRNLYIAGGKISSSTFESRKGLGGVTYSSYDKVTFKAEAVSHDTLERVANVLKLGIGDHHDLIFITRWYQCGRSLLTLKKYLPRVMLRQRGYEATLPSGKKISDINWFEDEQTRNIVWREFLLIERYGEKGYIEYPDAIRAKVWRIRSLTASS